MPAFIKCLIDPGLFAQTYKFRGFAALTLFCAITEALWFAL